MKPFSEPRGLYRRQIETVIRNALAEDIGPGDGTTDALRLGRQRAQARVVAKSEGILAGADAFDLTVRMLDRRARMHWSISEGKPFRFGQTVATVHTQAAALLKAERTALNALSRMSGIATATHQAVQLLRSTRTKLLDTRKTTPGLRFLEKRAVALGGGVNHRFALFDALMVKSNHVIAVGDFAETVRRALARRGRKTLICEVRSLHEIRIALALGVRWLLLDHFTLPRLRHAVAVIRDFEREHRLRGTQKIVIEVSGNVKRRRIPGIAACGVDYISSGAITHSAPASDFSLRWDATGAHRLQPR
jgi:nicotinate-nucleotide pyrophosphorylase (carboxylating)